jgi:ABC-2 type transport system permease protein
MSLRGIRPVALGVAWRVLHNVFTNPALLLPSLMFPLIFFIGFAGGLSRVRNVPGFDYPAGYTAFQFSFVLMQSAAMGGVFTGFGIARDFESGFARRLLLAASNRVGIVVGYAIAAVIRWGFTAAVVFTIALLSGMNVLGSGLDLVGLVMLAVIVSFAGTLWATGVAMRIRSIQAGPIMQLPIFLLLFLAPVFVPYELLRGWIHAAASVNPFTALLEAGRSLLAGQESGVALAYPLALGLVALFAVWAIRGLRSAERAG